MEEGTETVVWSSCGREESRIKKMRTLKDPPNMGSQGGADSKMVSTEDHLPKGKKVREVPGLTAMMSDGWRRTKIPSCTERKVFIASDCYGKGKCAEIKVNDELTQEKCQNCIEAKKSGSQNTRGGLSNKKSKKVNKRKVAGMHQKICVRNAKTVIDDARELVGHWSSCRKFKKSAVHPVVKETGPESQPPEANLVDEVIHRFPRLNTDGTSESGHRLADFDLEELLTELKAFKEEAREADPDEPGLVLIKFV